MMHPAALFFGAIVAVLGLADLWWVVIRTPVSARRVHAFGWRLSGFPLAIGAFVGRCALSAELGPVGQSYLVAAGVLVVLFCGVIVFHGLLQRWLDLPSWFGLLYIPCGIPIGAIYWPVMG